MNKNLIVISHQRSGTHLTIDSIRNNILVYKKNDFITLNKKIDEEANQKEFLEAFDKNIRVVKTHFLPDFQIYTKDKAIIKNLNELFEDSYLVYVYRNGLDVMCSLFEYMKKYDEQVRQMEFRDFLKTNNNFDDTPVNYNRMQFWKHHIQSWQNSKYKDKIFWIRYEEINSKNQEILQKIADNFGLSLNEKYIDIRLQNYKLRNRKIRKIINFFKGAKTTSVSARKGKSGDYKNYFTEETLQWFLDENKDFMDKLGYDYSL